MIDCFFQLLQKAKSGTYSYMQGLENDARHEVKQKMNRHEEATCMKSETECLNEKAENRIEEAADAIADKYDEIIVVCASLNSMRVIRINIVFPDKQQIIIH